MEDEATALWVFLLDLADQRRLPLPATCSLSPPAQGGATSSRWRPPAHAPYQAAATPANSEAAVQKPRITVLRRALCTAVVAAVIAASTRRSASGGAAPVSAATKRTRYAR